MLNKFYKIIHKKYSNFFNFLFFLRYLFAIFLISITIFLIIPNFFNYEKRSESIKDYLFNNYNLKIINYETIAFKALPLPKLELKNVKLESAKISTQLNVKNLKVYPEIFSIYNYENFQANKIILKENNIRLEASNFIAFIGQVISNKKKFVLDNLNIEIINEGKEIIKLKNIKFANFGYNENLISGKIFGKKFKVNLDKKLKTIKFTLLNSGMSADINFDNRKKKNERSGTFKSKILNTNIKFNFDYDDKVLRIKNFNLRNKNISLINESLITFKPFLEINSRFDVKEFNPKILKKINLNELHSSKNILKKINSKNKIFFNTKKFSRISIKDPSLNINLAYGRINYLKQFRISESDFLCQGDLNFLEDYPTLFFDCSIVSDNKKKLFKQFSINTKSKNESLKINFNGNLSILNKKINFKKILMNETYEATKEDLTFFKERFENILFDDNFFEIFNLKKIKLFIQEIS